MVAALYLGVRLCEKPYERVKLTDIDFQTKKISDLKEDAERLLNYKSERLGESTHVFLLTKKSLSDCSLIVITEFIYCGTVLQNDTQSLAEQGIKEGSTIHVFPKQEEVIIKHEPVTEADIHRACMGYRAILKEMSGNALVVSWDLITALVVRLTRSLNVLFNIWLFRFPESHSLRSY